MMNSSSNKHTSTRSTGRHGHRHGHDGHGLSGKRNRNTFGNLNNLHEEKQEEKTYYNVLNNHSLVHVKLVLSMGFLLAGIVKLTVPHNIDTHMNTNANMNDPNNYNYGAGIMTGYPVNESNKKHLYERVGSAMNTNMNVVGFTPSQQKAFLSSYGTHCTNNAHINNNHKDKDKDKDKGTSFSSSSNPILELYNRLEIILQRNGEATSKDGFADHASKSTSTSTVNRNGGNEKRKSKNLNRVLEFQQDLWKLCALGIGYAPVFVDFDQVYSYNIDVNVNVNVNADADVDADVNADGNIDDTSFFGSGIMRDTSKNFVIVHEMDVDVDVDANTYSNAAQSGGTNRKTNANADANAGENVDTNSTASTSTEHPVPLRVINSAMMGLGRTESGRKVARDMLHLLLNISSIDTDRLSLLMEKNYAMWKGRELYRLVEEAAKRNTKEWNLLQSYCIGLHSTGIRVGIGGAEDAMDQYHSHAGTCSRAGGAPCCQVEYNSTDSSLSSVRKFFLMPHGVDVRTHEGIMTDADDIPNHRSTNTNDAFHSQVIESVPTNSDPPTLFEINGRSLTPRLFDTLLENDCLPSYSCHHCLSKQIGGDQTSQCQACEQECACYCAALCQKIRPRAMKISKDCHVRIPNVRKDAHRLIPRIIHQTYFEPVTQDKYPNFSRLVQSWKLSGWEYHFYMDEDAEIFLSKHFPPEVREAYDLLIPGAYKADLFRYCVLLIHGGIYADVDVLLSTDLDKLVEDDIGFMVPVDEPGRSTGAGSCLWNGLLAAAPGHPIIAKTVEMVVNNIRNRFTAVDIDNMLCPTNANHRLPDLDLSHSFDLLYITGPCILGGALNTVLGRHIQSHIAPGKLAEIYPPILSDVESSFIPGRTIILGQNKTDMGSHRFTFLDRNIIVASTDMPDYDDRKGAKHYSDSTKENRQTLFGMKGVFKNLVPANELIKINVDT